MRPCHGDPIAAERRRTEVGKFFAGRFRRGAAAAVRREGRTILQHLADYHHEGHEVDAERLLPYAD